MARRTNSASKTFPSCPRQLILVDKGFKWGGRGTTENQLESRKQYLEAILPIDATTLVVTWGLVESLDPSEFNDQTRYSISVDRITCCDLTPVVKFRVPTTCVAKNDCEQVEHSQVAGTTQPFRVKLCAGDALLVSLTQKLADDCGPVVCGVRNPVPPPTDPTHISVARFYLYAS